LAIPALGERFEVERELGHGGSATVVLAYDRHLGRRVAVKLLSADLSAMLDANRFAREIRLTASLVHPNIVPLFDSGEVDGQLYYVMPFIDGDTLRARLERSGKLPVDEALRLTCDLAEAWRTRTARASSIATSSRRMSFCPASARCSPTSASRAWKSRTSNRSRRQASSWARRRT
jgi:serine/threonine protein kinase